MSYENHLKVERFLNSFQTRVNEFIKEVPVGELSDIVGRLSAGLRERNFPLSVDSQVVSEAYQHGITALQVEHVLGLARLALAGSKNLRYSEEISSSRDSNHYFILEKYGAELNVIEDPDSVIIEPHWGKRGQTGLTPISLVRKTPDKSGSGYLQGIQYEIPLNKFEGRFPSVDNFLGRILGSIQKYVNESQAKPDFNPHGFTAGRYHVGRGV